MNHQGESPDMSVVLFESQTGFESFWEAWPRKVGKPVAKKAWDRALKAAPAEAILAAAHLYAGNPGIPDKQFIPHPATWLNRAGWDDELPTRGAAPLQQAKDVLDLGRQIAAERRAVAS